MQERSSKRPKDINQLAKLVADIATGEVSNKEREQVKNPAAVALGKLGGKKGGAARARSLSPERRKEIAQVAASSRWKKD